MIVTVRKCEWYSMPVLLLPPSYLTHIYCDVKPMVTWNIFPSAILACITYLPC